MEWVDRPRRKLAPVLAIWVLSCAALIGVCVFAVDRPVATWSHDVLHRPGLAVLIMHLAEFRLFAALALGILVVCLVMRGPALRTALSIAVAILLAMVAVIVLKYACGRLWPDTWVRNNPSWIGNHAYGFFPFHGGEGWGSFPSGHTARMTAPCAVLWQRVPLLRPVWVLLPAAIGAALVASDFHFVGDCVAGAYVGIACAAASLAVVARR